MAMGMLGKALAGAGGAVRESSMELMRAEIMKQRDERLNQYAVGMQKDVVQPFQAAQTDKEIESRKDIAEGNNATSVEVAKIGADSRLSAKDGLKVLDQYFGGTFEGGMWFPDKENANVGLRAKQLFEQYVSNDGVAPIEAATRAAQNAKREQALGTLPIGRGAAEPTSPRAEPKPAAKSFKHLWGDKK